MSIHKKYIFITVILFIIEICIALFVRDKFIRPFFGDVLAVALIFSFFRIFYSGKGIKLAIGVLLFSFTLEILQYFQLVKLLGLENNKLAKTILGATFDWLDLLAYLIGVFLVFLFDKKFNNQPISQ